MLLMPKEISSMLKKISGIESNCKLEEPYKKCYLSDYEVIPLYLNTIHGSHGNQRG